MRLLGLNAALVFLAKPDETSEAEGAILRVQLLTAEERQRSDRLSTLALRHNYVVAHALVRLGLSECFAVSPTDWRFDRTTKPFVIAPEGIPPSQFSLSHTHGLVALLVTGDAPGGIDIESVERTDDLRGVAQGICAPNELKVLSRLSEDAWKRYFFQLWCLKEAYAKAVGLGLSLPWKNVAFDIDANSSVSVHAGSQINDDSDRWQFWLERIAPSHQVAVAIRVDIGAKIDLTSRSVRIRASTRRAWLEWPPEQRTNV